MTVEKGIEAADHAIDAFRGTPALLAMVLLQGLTLAGIAWSIHERATNAAEERKILSQERQILVDKCIIGPKVSKPLDDASELPKPVGNIIDPPK